MNASAPFFSPQIPFTEAEGVCGEKNDHSSGDKWAAVKPLLTSTLEALERKF